jgi:hypothetical protein
MDVVEIVTGVDDVRTTISLDLFNQLVKDVKR